MSKDSTYLDTIARLEPDIAMIDSGAGFASIAISLRRIADALETLARSQSDPSPRPMPASQWRGQDITPSPDEAAAIQARRAFRTSRRPG